jgi:hypothetical protein
MITKDTFGNADFIFGVDMDRLMIDNSAYSALIENMTDTAKRQIATNNEVLSFNITRRQVKRDLSLSYLGSPLMPKVFSDETISHQVVDSMNEMNEVPLLASGHSSGIKYLTASDIGLSKQTAGTYQYELSITVVDGFAKTIGKLLKRLYKTNNDVADYLALLDIPKNYDSKRRRVRISIRESATDAMSKSYVDALSYFQNLKNIATEYKRAASLIASRGATKESIGAFQKRLNVAINKVERLISKTGIGASPSIAMNRGANSGFANAPTVRIRHSFNNTVSVECRDNRYVDYFKGKGRIGGGLNIYSSTEVKNSKPKTTYLEVPMSSLQLLEARGVSLNVAPISVTADCEIENKQTMKTEKYIGSSAMSTGGLLKDDLSPIDLSTISIGSLVNTVDMNAAVSLMTPKLSSVSAFQSPTDKITKVMPTKITTGGRIETQGITTGGRTGSTSFVTAPELIPNPADVLILVAPQSSDVETCSVGTTTPMLKSLQWMSIAAAPTAKGGIVLCKQKGAKFETANQFFLMEIK